MAESESILLELDSQEEARFWAKVQKRGPDQCWPWIAKSRVRDYGLWRVRKILWRAPRVSYILANRKLLGDLHIIHECDNPICCNPGHLRAGTHKQNMEDYAAKGFTKGMRVGSKNGYAKLDEERVKEIKRRLKSGETQKTIAADMNVRQCTISQINTGYTWSHVTID